jgi:IPT/TIG domain
MYVLKPGKLGHNTSNDSGALQKIQVSTSELRGGPVYWNRSAANGGPLLYNWGVSDALKSFAFNGTTFATTPTATGNVGNQVWPGGILTLSANGSTPGSGVVWATVAMSGDAEDNPPVPGALYAFDAGNVANQLWNSNLKARDSLGNFAKFVPPLVASGRVYVATWSNQVVVYGLLSPIVTSVSPNSGPAAGGTGVTITGDNFVAGATVKFGTVAATSVSVASATSITAITPAHAPASVVVTVTNPDAKSGKLAAAFTYHK